MLENRTLGVSIALPWRDLYEAIWRPLDFPKWASGLSTASLRQEDGTWRADGPQGPVTLAFTGHNAFGIMDHSVDDGAGPRIHVPMRVVANGDGAAVLITLFRQPTMSDATFAADAAWIERDLAALKAFVERPLVAGAESTWRPAPTREAASRGMARGALTAKGDQAD